MFMIRRRGLLAAAISLVVLFRSAAAAEDLPRQLSDKAFWQLVTEFSEPGGYFRSDNFISNETMFQYVIKELKKNTAPGGVYLGVGPDQNFTYIVALRPRMAIIVDIRRQNMLQHLMYKALIELSADRAEFLSRLFSRKRPANLETDSTPEQLFDAYYDVDPDRQLFAENSEAVKKHLTENHGFNLSQEDQASLDYVFRAFYTGGPDLTYNGIGGGGFGGRGRMPSYGELMVMTDAGGQNLSYLATEENFRILQDMERKNLIIPVVGDFAGPKTIRAVGAYLKEHEAPVTAFYLSNVEQYLFQQDDDWSKFYTNVAALPVDSTGMFIRSLFNGMGVYSYQLNPFNLRSVSLLAPIPDLLKAFNAGEVQTYNDVIRMSHQ